MSEILQDNLLVITLLYSLAFFVLFFSIIIERGRTANFELIGTFMYLAGFGLMHGIGDILPVLPDFLSLDSEHAKVFRQVSRYFAAVSFTFLLYFGLTVFFDRTQRMRYIILGSPIISLVLFVIAADPFEGIINVHVVKRLVLGLPASFVAAASLLKMSQRFKQLNMSKIVVNFRGAAASFIAYGVFAGLFCASYPQTVLVLGVPIQLLRALAAMAIAYFTVRILSVFELEG